MAGLAFRHFNVLVVMAALTAVGMAPLDAITFFIISIIYIFFLSKVAFPSTTSSPSPPVFSPKENRVLGIYVSFAAIIGLFLPVAYILDGIVRGSKESVKAAAPHLFLLSAQVFMEGVTFSGKFSIPVRAFVPVSYNTNRLYVIMDWLRSEFSKAEEVDGGAAAATWRLYVGRGLAIANMALWSFNLLGFLLPVYLPRALKMYYSKEKA